MKNRGFTAVEVVISITIVLIIFTIGISSFIGARKTAEINAIADTIGAKLEEAKSQAISSKGGTAFGIKFASTTYSIYSGAVYNAGNVTETVTLSGNYAIYTSLSSSDYSVDFAHLSGTPTGIGTTTVKDTTNTSRLVNITIGSSGEIRVIK